MISSFQAGSMSCADSKEQYQSMSNGFAMSLKWAPGKPAGRVFKRAEFRLTHREHHVLLVGENERELVLLHNVAHSALQVAHEASILHIHAVRELAIALLDPAEEDQQ